jgi:hypothetical protein
MNYTYEQIKTLYMRNQFPFECEKYKINHFAIRNADLVTVDQFNDVRGVAYVDEFGTEHCLQFRATTKPGLSGIQKPINKGGTFILMPGFYENCWKIGKHNIGKEHEHEALVQNGYGIFKGWRDNNKDGKFDFDGKIYNDVTGLNDHMARTWDVLRVGGFSLACQVTFENYEHEIKMCLAKRDEERNHRQAISYALFQD